jgi:hypothetical protein
VFITNGPWTDHAIGPLAHTAREIAPF